MDLVAAAVEAALRQAVVDIVADVQSHLDTPYPGSSAPGEDGPHLRTGRLHGGISADVTVSGPILTLALTSSAPYSEALELGTARVAARPFMAPAADRWSGELVVRFQSIPPIP